MKYELESIIELKIKTMVVILNIVYIVLFKFFEFCFDSFYIVLIFIFLDCDNDNCIDNNLVIFYCWKHWKRKKNYVYYNNDICCCFIREMVGNLRTKSFLIILRVDSRIH